MANVNIKFNNKDYLLSCDDGQENSLKTLTKFLDKKYNELKDKLGNIGENKLLLITTIQLIDEYFDLKQRVALQKKKLDEIAKKFQELKELAIEYKEGKDKEINTLNKELDSFKKTIEEMKIHEKEHCEFFENEIKKRNIQPTKFLPLWDLLGVGLGFGSTLLGKKAAMLCTASVEEVIDEHYLSQINQLGNDEKNLKNKITKFRQDELDHKDIAYEKGATKKGPYSMLDLIIKTGSKIAINISEKI